MMGNWCHSVLLGQANDQGDLKDGYSMDLMNPYQNFCYLNFCYCYLVVFEVNFLVVFQFLNRALIPS